MPEYTIADLLSQDRLRLHNSLFDQPKFAFDDESATSFLAKFYGDLITFADRSSCVEIYSGKNAPASTSYMVGWLWPYTFDDLETRRMNGESPRVLGEISLEHNESKNIHKISDSRLQTNVVQSDSDGKPVASVSQSWWQRIFG